MDPSTSILLGAAGLGWLTACGALVYALVLRNRMAKQADRLWFSTQSSMQRAAQIVEDAEVIKAGRAEIAGLKKQLAEALLAKGKLNERLATLGAPGAADLVDAGIRSLYPDADDHVAPGGDGA